MATPLERTLTLKENAGEFQTETFKKDPDSVNDWSIDWTNTLNGDTIASSAWTSSAATITIDSDSETTLITTVVLSSGTAGTAYVLTNEITTTTDSLTMQRSITIYVEETSTGATADATLPTDPVDTSTNVGKVRLNIGDVETDPTKRLFSDTEITSFLNQNSSDVNLASAAALDALAAQATLKADFRKIGERSIDRRSMAKAYRELAQQYRDKVDEFPAVGTAEINASPFQAAEIICNEWVRNT